MTATPSTFDELLILVEFARRAERPGRFVDVGAHVGRYSTQFDELGWEVVAYEPVPEIFELLRQGLGRSSRARLRNVAVAEEPSTAELHVNEVHWGTSSLRPFLDSHGPGQPVEVIRLADEVGSWGPELRPLIVKIDAEGADFAALRGLDVGVVRPDLVMVEFMDERTSEAWGYTAQDIAAYMSHHGYGAVASEWAAVLEHSRRDRPGSPYVHLGLARWPLGHEPSWGNLLFVPNGVVADFEQMAMGVLVEHGRESAQATRDLTRDATRAERLERSLENRDESIVGLKSAVDRHEVCRRELGKAIEALTARVDELTSAVGQRDARVDELTSAVRQRDARVDELTSAVRQRDARVASLTTAVASLDRRRKVMRNALLAVVGSLGTMSSINAIGRWRKRRRSIATAHLSRKR